MSAPVIELAMFKTKEGIEEAAVREAAERSTAALARSGGMLHRELAFSAESRQWVDIIHWTDLEAAERAFAAFMEQPESGPFVELIDMEQVSMHHLRSVIVQGA